MRKRRYWEEKRKKEVQVVRVRDGIVKTCGGICMREENEKGGKRY